ncbi:SAM-dependent methyltransferase [Streptomyces sp. NPDC005438]|uniref:SAM-dependent methyltransferase n=1 Tax=Streptomyces sp. NPDC005438 TaxID=3156880 RepID=UPI0033AB0A4B
MSLQPDTPSSARFWHALLDGKNHFPVDQQLVTEMVELYPQARSLALASRRFQATAVEFVIEQGVRQFIDLGAGLPVEPNTHEIAQRVAPDARVVYVDHDPVVLAHARALLTSSPEGRTDYLDIDFLDRPRVLADAKRTLDLERPIALLWMSTLGHIPADQAPGLVSDYLDALPAGSYLALCDTLTDEVIDQANEHYAASGTQPYTARTQRDFERITEGREVVWPLQSLPDDEGHETQQYGLILRT